MHGYTEADKKISEGLKQYKKGTEAYKVSGKIELNNKFYREVIFTKKNLIRTKAEVKGYLYLDDENKPVIDRILIADLAKLGYYYEMFFNDSKAAGILATLKTEQEIQRERDNVEQIVEGLNFLYEQKVYAAERVKSVFTRNLNLREKSNVKLQELSSIIVKIKEQDLEFNLELLNKLYPYYEDVLLINFEKVVSIASIKDCIDEVIKEAEKNRKKWGAKFISNMVGKLIKVSDELSYFKRLITIYSSVLQMNSSQYIKYLNNINKEKIEERIGLVRY